MERYLPEFHHSGGLIKRFIESGINPGKQMMFTSTENKTNILTFLCQRSEFCLKRNAFAILPDFLKFINSRYNRSSLLIEEKQKFLQADEGLVFIMIHDIK